MMDVVDATRVDDIIEPSRVAGFDDAATNHQHEAAARNHGTSSEGAASAVPCRRDTSSTPIPMETAAVDTMLPAAPPAEAVGLPDDTVVAMDAEKPGCQRCKGNNRYSHTCGKQRNRPTIEPKERSRRQRTTTTADALVVPSKNPSQPRTATMSATSSRSRALPLAQPPAPLAVPVWADDVPQRDDVAQPSGGSSVGDAGGDGSAHPGTSEATASMSNSMEVGAIIGVAGRGDEARHGVLERARPPGPAAYCECCLICACHFCALGAVNPQENVATC